jgi:tetratricopeptide (TPR) repeat protein
MVSRSFGILFVAVVCWAQSQTSPLAYRQENSTTVPPNAASGRPPITPEMRGDIQMARKMYREAVESYSMADMRSAIILNKMGIAYHQMLELDLARRSYEKAVRADPKYSEAVNNLGTIYYAKKSYRKAVSQYNKALKLKPESASIYSNLGTAQFARKKYKQAAEAYETALRLDPEVFEHRGTHGVLLQERSVAERAKFHFYLAKTYAKAGSIDRALTYIRKAWKRASKRRRSSKRNPSSRSFRSFPSFSS